MAIVEELPGVEVSIVVDGVPLHEHIDTELDEEERTVTRYIEAASDKKFEIHINIDKDCHFLGDCLNARIWADGHKVAGPVFSKSRCTEKGYTCVRKGAIVGQNEVKEFVFASLETASDGHTLRYEPAQLKDLGTIKIAISHENKKGPRETKTFPVFQGNNEIGDSVISEKAIKGRTISHGVNYTAPVRAGQSHMHQATKPVRGQPDPFATCIFHYRSFSALKSMLIIPRTPTPPPLEERDVDSLNAAELREMQKELRQMKEAQVAAVEIKRERSDDNPRQRKKARPGVNATQLELNEDGRAREGSTPTMVGSPEVIELD